jgi:protein SCO1
MTKKALLALFIVPLVLAAIIFQSDKRGVINSYGEAQIGGSFTLTDTTGKAVKSEDFTGRFMLVYLGYTHCPDICPATLSVFSDTLKKLGADADKVSPILISIDAKNDSPQVLGEYLKAFDARITGLTGSEADITSVMKAYKAFASPAENAGPGNRLISHSGFVYLMDRQGKYVQHFDHDVKSDVLVAALKAEF